LLDNFARLVNNYKIKHEMFILSIIRYFETTIIIFEVIVLIFLVNIIVFILLLKKCNRLFKIIENVLISKKRDRSLKIKIIINSKKITTSKYYLNVIVVDV